MASRRLIAASSVALALGAVVVGVAVVSGRQAEQVHSDTISRLAPELGPQAHQLLPNLRNAQMVVPDRPHDPQEVHSPNRDRLITRVRRFTVSTNSLGMRGPELADPVPHPRILCVGDSVTFGWGVTYDESYPARLGELLEVDVVNAGVPALKPDHMGNWIEAKARQLQPDILLFTARPNHTRPDPFGTYARALAQATATGAKVGVVLPPISTFDVMGNQNRAHELQRIRDIAAKVKGGPVPVLELTDAFRAALPRPGYVMEQSGNTVVLEASAPAHGLAPEIIAAFESDPSFAEPLFFDGGHPDAAGFEVFSAAVATWTRQNLL